MSASDPLIGTEVAGYLVERRLGRGAVGVVYRAKQLSLNRRVALKRLSPALAHDEAVVTRFLDEAQAIAKLSHPNVVQVFDAVREGEFIFFSMEYFRSGSLSECLRREGTLSVDSTLALAQDVARALSWAEELGMIHRDIKPGNLLIADNGVVKVADLGLAISTSLPPSDPRKRRFAGSPRYMAPEQVIGKSVDHRADIYGLGCTLFHSLTGQLPFTGEAIEVMRSKVKLDPPLIEEFNPDVPEPLAHVVNAMIARRPSDRYSSCAEMAEALHEAQEEIWGSQSGDHGSTLAAAAAEVGDESWSDTSDEVASGVDRKSMLPQAVMVWGGAALAVLVMLWLWSQFGSSESDGVSGIPPEEDPVVVAGGEPSPPPPGAEPVSRASPANPARNDGVGPGREPPRESRARTNRLEQALEDELSDVLNDYGARLATPRDTVRALERLVATYPNSRALPRVKSQLGRVREALARQNAPKVAELLKTDVDILVLKGRFKDAQLQLESLAKVYPENRAVIEKKLLEVNGSAVNLWLDANAGVKQLELEGRFVEARTLLETTAQNLPSALRTEIQEQLDSFEEDQRVYEDCFRKVTQVETEVVAHLRAGEFEKAASFEARLPVYPEGSLGRQLVEFYGAGIRRQVEGAGAAWTEILQGLQQAIDAKRPVELVYSARPDKSKGSYRVESVDGSAMTLETKEARNPVGILSMTTSELTGLLGGSGALDADGIEGLGWLLFYRRSPCRARELLLDERVDAERRARYGSKIDAAEETFLSRLADRAAETLLQIATDRGASASSRARKCEALASDIVGTLLEARLSPAYEAVKPRLVETFVKARTGSMQVDAGAKLFHGEVESSSAGKIKLSYEFSSNEELKDFVAVGGGESGLEIANGAMRILGEYRFLRGNPFLGRITVRGNLEAEAYSPLSPNINIALWTTESDRVTPGTAAAVGGGGDGTPDGVDDDSVDDGDADIGDEVKDVENAESVKGADGVEPGEYFVFGLGFHTPHLMSFDVPDMGGSIELPGNVFLRCDRGRSIGSNSEEECIWGKSLGRSNRIRGRQSFAITMGRSKTSWTVDQKSVPLKRAERFKLAEGPNLREGSITIFTNGEVTAYDSLVIEGDLNPDWTQSQLASRAMQELEAILGGAK